MSGKWEDKDKENQNIVIRIPRNAFGMQVSVRKRNTNKSGQNHGKEPQR